MRALMTPSNRSLLPSLLALSLSALAACNQEPTAQQEKDTSTTKATATAMVTAAPTATTPPGPKPGDLPAPSDVAAAPADAVKTPSGLATKILAPGTGKDHPTSDDSVKVNYTGWTTDGRMFDSSVARGQPATFKVSQVIKGWTEGLQLMVTGEKRRLWIPKAMAYGDHPRMGAPAGDLVFDVELVEITPAPKPPPVPEDVKAAPPTAKKTASGLAYRVLKKGSGPQSPKATDSVMVNYSGWTPDGKMFDSSVTRGQPASFRVDGVIKGWTEGLQLMKVGDTVRFWIPGALAYGDKPARPGTPAGPLVFDVELISVKSAPPPPPGVVSPSSPATK
jgi:FKBP-type peptidyl-prolyl cis-trans isomerase